MIKDPYYTFPIWLDLSDTQLTSLKLIVSFLSQYLKLSHDFFKKVEVNIVGFSFMKKIPYNKMLIIYCG